MTKLQFLKICALNLIFGTTVIAGDGLRAELESKVIKYDKIIRVYGPIIGLEESEAPSVNRFTLAKSLRDSYTMSDEERENLQDIIFAISENSIDALSLVKKLNDAAEKGHLGIVRHLAVYCPSEDVDLVAGGAFMAKKPKITETIMGSNAALGNPTSLTRVIFRSRAYGKTEELKHLPDGR